MVLDGVVGAALEDLGDLSPLVVDDPVHEEQDPFFLLTPVDFLDEWIEVVVPSLSALLADSILEVLGNESPLLRAIGDDEHEHSPIFLLSPGSFHICQFVFFG